jgi:hypothetical protein
MRASVWPRVVRKCVSCDKEREHYTGKNHKGASFVRARCVECRAAEFREMDSTRRSWRAMRSRVGRVCTKGDYTSILCCGRWASFDAFVEDMGPRPKGTTLDRIDNAKGYEPGNCRWATREQQNRNRRCARIIEWRGERKCVAEWAEAVGMPRKRVEQRLNWGWSVERALTEPVHTPDAPVVIAWRGQTKTVAAWARELGLSPDTLASRLKRGWSVERAMTEPRHAALARGRSICEAEAEEPKAP